MRISRIQIKNFRLLRDIDLCLEDISTIIVGRNNTGKTSLTELFRRLLSGNAPSFRLEDISLGAHKDFWKALGHKQAGKPENEVRDAIPTIEAYLTVNYDEDSQYGPLSDFIIDLDPNCSDAFIVIRHQLQDGKIEALFEDLAFDDNKKQEFFKAIRERVPRLFATKVIAVDPNDPTNERELDLSHLRGLLKCGFINAQRGLDDATQREADVLGRILQALLHTAMLETADPSDKGIALELEKAVEEIQSNIDKGFNTQLTSLLPAFNLFGYPGLRDPELGTETTLDVQRLLKDNTKVHYAGVNGINLPEAYSGLGIRNLIFILLKLLEFFKAFKAEQAAPGIHFVFIEEPEAHLHPQMQEVFIRKLGEITTVFANTYNEGRPWPVQFVVTTHSSHMGNEAPFDSMRYFLTVTKEGDDGASETKTVIKDLRKGLGGEDEDDRKFLHQYMTLTRCDLLFADKAVLIEGTSERLLLPRMIEKLDEGQELECMLSSQYVTVMEVGGAYAHRFSKLLDFLELRTLIITDLDSVDVNDRGKACKVSQGTGTSNACIRDWFDGAVTPDALIQKTHEDKIKDSRRLAYQVPETDGEPCGRSFEEAFILANADKFGIAGDADKEQVAWDKAKEEKKTEFALRYAIEDSEWVVPRYIKEGLAWLRESDQGSHVPSPVSLAPGVPAENKSSSHEENGDG